MKIALLFRSYGPYHVARLRAARKHYPVLALEHADIDPDYGWDVREEKRALGVATLSAGRKGRLSFASGLAPMLTQFGATAVAIPGYSEKFALSALRTCHALKIPTILMSDSHAGTAGRGALRSLVKSRLVALFQSALVAGTDHARYLAGLGFPKDKIAMGYDVVDNRHFASADLTGRQAHPSLASPYFFCCARFVEKKNIEGLIDAFVLYRQAMPGDGWDLVIAGDGPLREKIEWKRFTAPCAANIHLLGHKSYGELPSLYCGASAFVLPSAVDEWGLVVNEAMAAGLPVLVSEGAGCNADLVKGGVNGFTFDSSDISGLAALMCRLATASNRHAMGQASRAIIADWDLTRFASSLGEAAQIAMQAPASRQYIGPALAATLSYRP